MIKEIEANTFLQQEIEDAIRRRQKSFSDILNPKDIRRVTEKAIKEIVKENRLDAVGGLDE
jgi:uncharacterized protein (UPF0147 family)